MLDFDILTCSAGLFLCRDSWDRAFNMGNTKYRLVFIVRNGMSTICHT